MFANDYDSVSDIYDIYNRSDYDIRFYLDRYKSFKGKAVELMAGTGRLAIPLLKEGIDIDCVDISGGLLGRLEEKLKKENLNTNVIRSDIRFLELDEKYDAVIIAFNSFSEIIEREDQKMVLHATSTYLAANGELIITLHNPAIRRKLINNKIMLINEYDIEDDKMLFFISSNEDENAIVQINQFYDFYDSSGNLINKKKLELKFKLITRSEMESLIKETGYAIKEFYGNYDKSTFDEKESPFMIFVLTK
jgi:predicted RNA methylase